MKTIASLVFFCTIMLFSCSDRDDNLRGVQIRVENKIDTVFTEVIISTLSFSDLQADETTFYQQFDGLTLPQEVTLINDTQSSTVAAEALFEIDTTEVNLFTYRIKASSEDMNATIDVLKD